MSLETIRHGIADTLKANLTGFQGQISPYLLSAASPPTLLVKPADDPAIDYHQAMGNGVETWHIVVQGFVALASDLAAQKNLDKMLEPSGPNSVKAALESDTTLGGAADYVIVDSASYREYERPDGTPVLGAEWRLRVLTSG